MELIDPIGLAPKGAPIKASPVSVLQVNQNGQNEEHYNAGQDAFLIHEGETSHRGPANAKRETAPPKVNDTAARVKRVWSGRLVRCF
jgi:hypothetical protein